MHYPEERLGATRAGTFTVHSKERLHRVNVVSLSRLSEARRDLAPNDTAVDRIVSALSTNEHEQPDVRAQVRLDWGALARQLPERLRKILRWLAIGASKTWIARRLKITNGRASQLLDKLGREVLSFFGPELLPAGCAE